MYIYICICMYIYILYITSLLLRLLLGTLDIASSLLLAFLDLRSVSTLLEVLNNIHLLAVGNLEGAGNDLLDEAALVVQHRQLPLQLANLHTQYIQYIAQ